MPRSLSPEPVLTDFIRALRNADVRVSPAETLDALHAVELIGYADRSALKNSLALALSKTVEEKALFDACFERFFSPPRARPLDSPTAPAASSASADTAPAPASALGQLLVQGDQAAIGMAIAAAGRRSNVQQIEVFTQKGVYSRRIVEAMGHAELQQEINALAASERVADRRAAQDLARRHEWLRVQIRQYVEQQFLLHADVTGRRLREDLLRDVRISSVDQRHRRSLQEIVRRMAKRLVSTYSHRRRVVRRGQLHVPRTLRRNMKYDDAIFDLQWKSTKVDRPKVLALCDVSGSVADYAGFMLMFLYSLEELLPKIRSFAFCAELGEVSDAFAQYPMEEAIAWTLRRYGSGVTDYGQALADFQRLCFDDIDRRTTIVILGDARNNQGNTRVELLKQIYERSRRVIWLNPEPRAMWNTGDSEMRQYAVYCHQVEECGTLQQLERVVGRLVRN